ncbi:MAG TPA: DNA starvation/stationary phase protection protein [Vicinamibacterales bacterium]|nr:DNA starvation/stationary phase protection protein [Vicinamibacterales bacterium]
MAVGTTKTPKKPNPREVAKIVRDLTRENREQSPVVQLLRRQVANSFVVYVNHKHCHWQTFGPHFRDLHKLFDEFAAEVLESIDPIAERVRMIGPDPPASLQEFAKLASVGEGVGASMNEMIEASRKNSLIMIEEFRRGAKIAEEHDDPGTVDLCSRLVQIHEKQEWWLRDMLSDGDGL